MIWHLPDKRVDEIGKAYKAINQAFKVDRPEVEYLAQWVGNSFGEESGIQETIEQVVDEQERRVELKLQRDNLGGDESRVPYLAAKLAHCVALSVFVQQIESKK